MENTTDATAAIAAVNALHEAVVKAFTEMGNAMLGLAQQQHAIAETINQVVTDRNAQLELIGTLLKQVETLAERVGVLTRLVDADHAQIEVLSLELLALKPGSKNKGCDVN
jgi:predicted O-linked N-acetylglucosamine transferase (SPINDLY family)